MRGYKFVFAFENAREIDYVTENFYIPLIAGSVPVYLGAQNVAEFAPDRRSFVDASEFKTPEELARYLMYRELCRSMIQTPNPKISKVCC